jgi:uncharacterized protein YfaP (DUF2135 family)
MRISVGLLTEKSTSRETCSYSHVSLGVRNWSRVPKLSGNGGQMPQTRTEDEGPITAPFCVESGRNGVAEVAGGLKNIKIYK